MKKNQNGYLDYTDTVITDFKGDRLSFGGNGSGKSIFETDFGMVVGQSYKVLEVYQHPSGHATSDMGILEKSIARLPYTEFVVLVGDKKVRLEHGWFLKPVRIGETLARPTHGDSSLGNLAVTITQADMNTPEPPTLKPGKMGYKDLRDKLAQHGVFI
jgi:hypothetical protein